MAFDLLPNISCDATEYVQIKPILAIITVVLKSLGKYEEGKISPSNGYTWVSFTYSKSFLACSCPALELVD